MSDAMAGRRVLEHFGLLAVASAAEKKPEKKRSPFVTPRESKVVSLERPRKSK